MTLCTQIYGPPIRLTNPFFGSNFEVFMHPFSPNFTEKPHCWTNCMSTLVCMSTRVDIQYVHRGGHTVCPITEGTKCLDKPWWTYSSSCIFVDEVFQIKMDIQFVQGGQSVCPSSILGPCVTIVWTNCMSTSFWCLDTSKCGPKNWLDIVMSGP